MKEFIVSRNTFKKAENQPDYQVSVKIGEKWQTIGGAWLREGKNGKFFSCKLSNTSSYGTGFTLVEDKPEKQMVHGTVEYPKTIDASEIPF